MDIAELGVVDYGKDAKGNMYCFPYCRKTIIKHHNDHVLLSTTHDNKNPILNPVIISTACYMSREGSGAFPDYDRMIELGEGDVMSYKGYGSYQEADAMHRRNIEYVYFMLTDRNRQLVNIKEQIAQNKRKIDKALKEASMSVANMKNDMNNVRLKMDEVINTPRVNINITEKCDKPQHTITKRNK